MKGDINQKGVRKTLNRFKSKLALFLSIFLIAGTIMPQFGGPVAFAAELADIDYDPKIGEEVPVAPNFHLQPAEGEQFAEGYLQFDITEEYVDTEKLFLPDGESVTLSDGSILSVKGTQILLNDVPIASIDNELNGEAGPLRINLSAPLPNGDFEKGELGELVPDWTINNTSVGPNGSTINQIWLGDLASKTQNRAYDSVASNGDGTYTVTGPNNEYTYVTNVNYNMTASTGDLQKVEGFEAVFGSLNKYVKNVYSDTGTSSQALEIGFLSALLKNGDYAVKDGKIASSFGIEAISSTFKAKKGDYLSFDWKANDGGDDYEVYGFLVNEQTGEHTEILYGRGSAQDWTTNNGEVQEDGTYRFRFVAGSFNRTDGTTHGATLSIDNIRVVSSKVVSGVVDAIAQLVTYQNTEYSGDRPVKISVINSEGNESAFGDNALMINMSTKTEAATTLSNSLIVDKPEDNASLYDRTAPTITGKTEKGSTVSVKVTDPNGQSVFDGDATVDEAGNWSITLTDELIKGDYTIEATASKGGAEATNTSTFHFIDKTSLEDYYNQVKDLAEEQYRNGWKNDDTDDDIEFEPALTTAAEILEQIKNGTNTPSQAEIDKALADLQEAKNALEKHPPIEKSPATYEHGDNKITIEFDKNIKLTADNPAEGFTVTVDGTTYSVTNAEANGNSVTLTVDQPLSSDVKEIKVEYTPDETPNLFGDEENGTADEPFSIIAKDEFGAALQIQTTKGITNNLTPTFTGTVHQDADKVTLTFKDKEGNEIVGLKDVEATVKDGTWTYTIPEGSKLANGVYTFEVTGTNNEGPRTITKSAEFTVVDKTSLTSAVDSAEKLNEKDYRAGWEDLVTELEEAKAVLTNRTATQAEVDKALADLQAARDALEKHPPKEQSPATYEHGDNKIIVEFDKTIKLTSENPTEGFTVTVDGKTYAVTNAEANGNNVTLTVDQPLSSDAKEIKVDYTPDDSPNVFGDEENGTAEEAFSIVAKDEFGAALQINSTKGNTDDQTPTFTGTVHQDADNVTLTFKDKEGKVVLKDVEATVIEGTWTYTIPEGSELSYGAYTYDVTATNNEGSRTVSKSAEFNVVDKTSLTSAVDSAEKLKQEDYRSGWEDFAKKLEEAQAILTNPTASQSEVDKALEDLQAARDALEKHPPKEQSPATYEHGDNKITIEFDKNIKLTAENPAEGFTVTVDGKTYAVTNAEVNGDNVTLTVDQPLSSDAKEVKVAYTPDDSPNVFGDEENGTADEPFSIIAKDEFGAALQIEKTKGNTDTQTPTFTGTIHQDADKVTLTFKDKEGKVVLKDVEATVKEGIWTYTIPEASKLAYGAYTFEVTGTNNEGPRTVTKSAEFKVVDKTALTSAVDSAEKLHEEDHRAGWDEFAEKLEEAQEILTNPAASQSEVDKALADLQAARDALEKHPPKEETPATYEHGDNKITIVFDKNIKLTAENRAEGFTVTVDGKAYAVTNAEVNGNTVTLTVDQPLSSDAEEVKVEYTPDDSPNIFGDEENGTADESFSIVAKDKFGAALQIDGTKGNTDDRTPSFYGDIYKEADIATLTIVDAKGEEHVVNAVAKINGEGWIFEDWTGLEELQPGDYTVFVTAKNSQNGRTVTKSANFTIVDKTALESAINSAEDLEEDDHRSGWEDFAKELKEAQKVLDNSTASQEAVQKALDDLKAARAALEKHAPIVNDVIFNQGYNEMTVVFDKDITFASKAVDTKAGFTVTVNGKEVEVIAVQLVKANPDEKTNKVKLILTEGTALLSDDVVEVTYNKAAGSANLVGDEENGTAVEDFTYEAGDPFGKALQIDDPNGITNDTTPLIKGTADTNADHATITIIGPDGNKVVISKADLTIREDGTWTYQIANKLAAGKYVVEVTTSEKGRPDVTKDHQFIVVDKTELIAKKDEITKQNLKENNYTVNSWTNFEKAFNHANDILENAEATQEEVDQALAELQKAFLELVNKIALEDEESESTKLDSKNYSTKSWAAYIAALTHAKEVLSNPQATQEEVDKALAELASARAALTVDKTLLDAEENKSAALNEEDYSQASWKNYLKVLKNAQNILNDPNATQVEIDMAIEALAKARAALTVDKKPLQKAEKESEELKESDYTSDSWSEYEKALENARKVLEDDHVTQSQIDAALSSLENAQKQLELKKQELPKTATNTTNWLLLGVVLLLVGLALFIGQKRKVNTKDI